MQVSQKPDPYMPLPPRNAAFRFLALAAVALVPAGAVDFRDQVVEEPPVVARLQVVSRPADVASPLTVRVEATVPSLSHEESLATGQPARFRPEPQLGDWLRIPRLPLKHIQRGEESRPEAGVTVFHWVYRWEAEHPGAYVLPALRIEFRPSLAGGQPLETVFAEVPVAVEALIEGGLAAAQPRPAVTELPHTRSPALRWILVALTILLWALVRFGYVRMRRRARDRAGADLLQDAPHRAALKELRDSRSSREAYEVLCRFLRVTSGIELAKVPPEELREHPGLDASARRLLPPIVEELQPGAYSPEDAPLSPAQRGRLQEFFRTCEA